MKSSKKMQWDKKMNKIFLEEIEKLALKNSTITSTMKKLYARLYNKRYDFHKTLSQIQRMQDTIKRRNEEKYREMELQRKIRLLNKIKYI